MAEFRKIFYALALVTLLAALTAPAFAATELSCSAGAVTPPFLRTEGHTETVGDILIECIGGTSTIPGNLVPRVNIRVRLTTNITSKLLDTSSTPGTNFNEALLIIDEPNSGRYAPNSMASGQTGERPILNCGNVGAPDNSVDGRNVCDIFAPNHPSRTYDGTPNGWWTLSDAGPTNTCDGLAGRPAAGTFGCGRPNIFQGRQVLGNTNMVEFNGVPFDPPGEAKFNSLDPLLATPWVRTLRIVNLRTDANAFFVAGNNSSIPIFADLSFSGNVQALISNPREITVGYAQTGLLAPTVSGANSFVQCIVKQLDSLNGIVNSAHDLNFPVGASTLPKVFIRFTEGFAASWKTKGWEAMEVNSGANHFLYDGGFDIPANIIRQNVPGAIYGTESGFTAPPSGVDPTGQNPPTGTKNQISLFANQTIANSTGISGAGIATNGTRLQILFGAVPSGVTLYTPEVVYLTRVDSNDITGIAVRNTAITPDLNAFAAPSSPLPTDWLAVGANNLAVYEILYDSQAAREELTVPIGITTNLNLLPQTIDTATTVKGGFAPAFDPSQQPGVARTDSDPVGNIPRFFKNLSGGGTLFTIDKCNCNLLFPYVSNAAGFDTGIAIANTSLSPTDSIFKQTLAQAGPIQFWYFANGSMLKTECTNTANKGVCPGTQFVAAGQVATFTVARGSNTWGLNGGPANFTGYLIAKTGFQYCHGFAYFSDLDRLLPGPGIAGTSVGYLALVMDTEGSRLVRTNNTAFDSLVH